jgi:GDP-4-dehydro-6-deoxy-D-mannose reductase
MRVLVTGAASFTAAHLVPGLVSAHGAGSVSGTDITGAAASALPCHQADITDGAAVDAVVRAVEPDLVFHLAGIASPDGARCAAVNVTGTKNLLEACAALARPPRCVVVSSAAVYGAVRNDETPVAETTPLRPATPYGTSKARAEAIALDLHERGRLPVLVIRPFNLVGPGLPAGLAPSDFARQVREIRDGAREPRIRTGNLTPRRDFVDVRDAVRAYALLAAEPACYGKVFNVGSGKPVAVGDLLETLLTLAGVRAAVETDPALLRPVDVPELVADVTALRNAVAWTPEVSLTASLRDMLDAAGG